MLKWFLISIWHRRQTCDPADVGHAAEDVVGVVVAEHVLVRERSVHEISGSAVSDSLRSSGTSGCVQDKQEVLGVHRFRVALGRHRRQGFGQPDVGGFDDLLIVGPLHDEDVLDGGALVVGQRLCDCLPERNDPAATKTLVGRNDGHSRHVLLKKLWLLSWVDKLPP